jgi:hypothetical protein
MADTPIEIHEVSALRVDAAGRVGRLRVVGVADRNDQRISVDACVADLGTSASWRDQQASATARIVDPARTFIGYHEPAFALDLLEPTEARRKAWLWVAEIDVLQPPAVPPIGIGRQEVPVNARASYVFDARGASPAIHSVTEIEPVVEFDVGVLFVHGIGLQRRAETLSEWSAPVLRWINAWLKGVTDDIARRLRGAPLDGWLHSLLVRGDLGEYDVDRVDRARYAEGLVRKALAPTYGDWRAEVKAAGERTLSTSQMRPPTAAEGAECREVAHTIDQELQASAVGGAAEFREAYVLDVGARSVAPSSVEMHVEAMAGDGYILRSRWMLAESHWGESFWAPSFFRFGRWCLLTAPVVLVHYIAIARLRQKSLPGWILSVLGLSTGVTLAQLAFLALMVLWLVPWERVRAYVLRIQLGLAGVVGDSYILLEDPVQRRAILDRVQRDLNWLVQRCRSVVVIAHSQGAAVAERVLSNREAAVAANIHSFITLGAGVQTLKAIEDLARSRDVNIAGWMGIGCSLALGAVAALALAGAWPAASALAIIALLGLTVAAKRATNAHPGRRVLLPGAARFRPWLDFFAANDLVPYGPLVDPKNNGDHYRPKEVRNRDSYLADHVLYWQNPEQVVGPIARQVGAAAGFAPLAWLLPDDAAVLARLERARISRLGFLAMARAVTVLATALQLVLQWPALAAIGRWVFGRAQSMVGAEAAGVLLPGVSIWLQAAGILMPIVLYKTLVNATFDAWTTAEVERLLRRSAGTPATHWAVTFTLLLALTLAATICLVWPPEPWAAVAVTVLGSAVLAWLARRVHRSRVDG